MPKIFLGPAGIPLSSRGKGSVDGVKRVKELGLNAMEVEFVQGVKMSVSTAKELGEVSKEMGVRLSVHAPYYINLCSSEREKIDASKKRILDTAERAHAMGADAIAIHVGFYGDYTPEECYSMVRASMGEVIDQMREKGIDSVKLGVETMAKETAFGTIDEVIKISKELKGVIPYIDWAHTFARQGGKIDYGEILDRVVKELGLTHVNSHFESLKLRNGKYVDVHEPIERNSPPFEPLAKEILKRDLSISLICESPRLEEDALIMKKVLESLGYRL
ncbi:TIM barrel protein [Metallosphaera tengchongensis]|uniref:TIM barrel protein n=1 Tax=Metallosphaera tengchongensis TaxID=1532350 RepID=A0A6N0NWZ9_9CREN|nr:deoxyribonuclease IV [Metallosphaera tengchongensis]QKR00393.1 TIM barrel protein [Metallosphaera tengchongensis]